MAALSITASQVVYVSGALEKDAVAGEAFTTGDAVYKSDTNTWLKAQCDGTAVEAGANDCGIALFTAAAAGARGSVAIAGPSDGQGVSKGAVVTLGAGAAPAAGLIYGPGTTAGSWVPSADWATTNKVNPVLVGIGSNQVQVVRAYNAGSVRP